MESAEKRACPWKEKCLRTPDGKGFIQQKNWFLNPPEKEV
jgi:hypothetical protein